MSRLYLLTLFLLCPAWASAQTPRFEIEVAAVLSKAGCNAGTCHGNQNGKGGFQLSLRGQDAQFDFESIVQQNGGRRINLFDPASSLLLQKPTMEVAHQGGKRLSKSSELYGQLRNWIARGAAEPKSQVHVAQLTVQPREAIRFSTAEKIELSVEAKFSDGTTQDITDIAVYETSNLNVEVSSDGVVHPLASGEATVIVRYLDQQLPVRVAFLDRSEPFVWNERQPRNYIDEHIFAKLKKFQANPAPVCEDHVFLRRAYLDLLGLLPTAKEAREFVSDVNPLKRDAIIDSLLARPEFADNWALKWADLLRVEEKVLDRKGVEVFHRWIRDSIAAGMPMNEFVAELLLARGSTYENPPANYFRALRKTNTRGEAAARVFLGTRLQCAQCHNHPFDRWTQDDYYAWSALFARVGYELDDTKRLDKLDKNQFVGDQIVKIENEGDVKNPSTGKMMLPRFLGHESAIDQDADRLKSLALWLTSPENRQFAKSQVNRLWYHLMGQGLVNPVDDFRVTNPASHPDLLEELTDDFISSGFDVRHTLRLIAKSETYQLDSLVETTGDEYAHVTPKRLSAEQLLDAQSQALSATLAFNGHPVGMRAVQLPGVHKVRKRDKAPSPADRFLTAFGKPDRQMTCECERSDATTLSQALFLVNGDCMDDLLTQKSNLIGQLLDRCANFDQAIDELYWSAVSRSPSEDELHHSHSVIARAPSARAGLEDVAWALLNAKEFLFRH